MRARTTSANVAGEKRGQKKNASHFLSFLRPLPDVPGSSQELVSPPSRQNCFRFHFALGVAFFLLLLLLLGASPPLFFFTRFSTSSLAPQFREAHHLCKHSTSSSSPPLFICFSRCVLPSPSHFVNRWRRGCEANIERDWSILRRGVARKRFVGKLLLRLPPARADVDSEVSLASQSSFNFFSSSRSFSVSPCLFLSLS